MKQREPLPWVPYRISPSTPRDLRGDRCIPLWTSAERRRGAYSRLNRKSRIERGAGDMVSSGPAKVPSSKCIVSYTDGCAPPLRIFSVRGGAYARSATCGGGPPSGRCGSWPPCLIGLRAVVRGADQTCPTPGAPHALLELVQGQREGKKDPHPLIFPLTSPSM